MSLARRRRRASPELPSWAYCLLIWGEAIVICLLVLVAMGSFGYSNVTSVYEQATAWVVSQTTPSTASLAPATAQTTLPPRDADFTSIHNQIKQFVGKDAPGQPYQPSDTDAITVSTVNQGIQIRLNGSMLWPSGAAELKPAAKPALDEVIETLRGLPNRIRIEGHTDNMPIKGGRFASNLELSEARAQAVANYLVEKGRIPQERISVMGYGASRPIAPNDTPEHRKLNRRAEIVIIYGDGSS